MVNIIHGSGAECGEELCTSPLVDKIAFTGSTAVGSRIMQLAAGTVKKVTLELGGKSANIILDDADLDMAIDGSLFGCFFHQGQACESGTRLLVSEAKHDEVVARLVERTKQINCGDPLDMMSAQGPLISARQRETVEGYIKKGVEEGAKVAVGGGRPAGLPKGYYVEPTILTDVKNTMTVAQEEIFGPVLVVIRYKDIDDAIRIANDSIYGLGGAVWSRDDDKAMEVAKRVRTGTMWINEYHMLSAAAPFGGYKQSGIGREFGMEGILEYMQIKHIHRGPGAEPRRQVLVRRALRARGVTRRVQRDGAPGRARGAGRSTRGAARVRLRRGLLRGHGPPSLRPSRRSGPRSSRWAAPSRFPCSPAHACASSTPAAAC